MLKILRQPDAVRFELDDGNVTAVLADGLWSANGAQVSVDIKDGLVVTLKGSAQPIRRVFLRWKQAVPAGKLSLPRSTVA